MSFPLWGGLFLRLLPRSVTSPSSGHTVFPLWCANSWAPFLDNTTESIDLSWANLIWGCFRMRIRHRFGDSQGSLFLNISGFLEVSPSVWLFMKSKILWARITFPAFMVMWRYPHTWYRAAAMFSQKLRSLTWRRRPQTVLLSYRLGNWDPVTWWRRHSSLGQTYG